MAAIKNALYQTNLVAATNCVWLPLTQSGQANSQNDVNQWIQDPTDWSMIMFCYNTSPDDVSFAILTSVCQKRVYVWTSCKRWWNVSLSILQLNFPLPVPQVEICKCVSVLSILAEETNTHSTKLTLEPFFTIISREIRPQHWQCQVRERFPEQATVLVRFLKVAT